MTNARLVSRPSRSGLNTCRDRLKIIYTPRITSATLSSTERTCSITSLTLSSIACVTLRFPAMVIRASSCVSLSRFFSASSILFLPISVFPYFSEHHSVTGDTVILNYSLIRPCFISLVAIPRIVRTSVIIRTIVSNISGVDGTGV